MRKMQKINIYLDEPEREKTFQEVFSRESFDAAHEYFKIALTKKTQQETIENFPDVNKLVVNQIIRKEKK